MSPHLESNASNYNIIGHRAEARARVEGNITPRLN